MFRLLCLLACLSTFVSAELSAPKKNEVICLIGNGLGERMVHTAPLQAQLALRFPQSDAAIYNLCKPGDTPGLRPHPSRASQWAFPDAETFHSAYQTHQGEGFYETPDQWLTRLRADTIIAFFGFNESFAGQAGVENYKAELSAFVGHTLAQNYNGKSAPRLILAGHPQTQGPSQKNIQLYNLATQEIALTNQLPFVDFETLNLPLERNGFLPTKAGYETLATIILDKIYAAPETTSAADPALISAVAKDRSWLWRNDYQMLNGVHVHGHRHEPFGPVNYPPELRKVREMHQLRLERIYEIARGTTTETTFDDSKTSTLPLVESNYTEPITYLDKPQTADSFTIAEGFQIDLFASEADFPDLANPMQIAFDTKGRLWVATMPSYPHWKPGDPRPNDKLLILEDTDGDNKADKQTVFADSLHLPIGFAFTSEGVVVAQQPELILLKDTDGDDRADEQEVLFAGFDTHDSHHSISAFSTDPLGRIYLMEGRFLHSQVETQDGPVRTHDGGVYRYDPSSNELLLVSRYDFSNPWGLAYDKWGNGILADASGGRNVDFLPATVKVPHGREIPTLPDITPHRVRPTSGAEIIYSSHFPDHMQGDFLIQNTIGYRGIKQHSLTSDGSSFKAKLKQDFLTSTDPNFRPADLEFAPDGTLYIVDFQTPLVGHMQHSARDPKRDKTHGRIFRISHKTRPLVTEETAYKNLPEELLKLLNSTNVRQKRDARAELQKLPSDLRGKIVTRILEESANLEDHILLELYRLVRGQNPYLLEALFTSKNPELRRAVAEETNALPDPSIAVLAGDSHPRVRLATLQAASWRSPELTAEVITEIIKHPIDLTMKPALQAAYPEAKPYLSEEVITQIESEGLFNYKLTRTPKAPDSLTKPEKVSYIMGHEIYHREAHCATCHQSDGKGLENIYPPLAGSEWVIEDAERLIKLTLHGLWGPIEVAGK